MAKSPSHVREGLGEGVSSRDGPPASPPPTPAAGGRGAIVLAVVTGAHGVAGEVRLKVFADDLGAHRSFNGGTLTAKTIRVTPGGAIARFAEIADRTAAEALRGTELTVPRDALPPLGEGEYYHADLLGLPAVSEAGVAIGTIVSVDNFGAGDVLEIERFAGGRFMIPMNDRAVPRWNDEALVVADGWHE